MPVVDLYADFIGGRSKYNVEDLRELKWRVAEYLNRNDIMWNMYVTYINDEPVVEYNANPMFTDGDVVKFISQSGIRGFGSFLSGGSFYAPPVCELKENIVELTREFKGNSSSVITRPFFDAGLTKPDYAFMQEGKQYVGVYACSKCGGPLRRESDICHYCGFSVNWNNV